jgi:hypothetical protein
MNDIREDIMDQLDRITAYNPASSATDYYERYGEVVDALEALVIGYSVDVTSVTAADIPACSEEDVAGYEVQDLEEKAKGGEQIHMDFSKEKESHIAP